MQIKVKKADITKLNVDAIVNAANSSLLGGGGVDDAIHRAGGKSILEECKKIREKQGKCPAGEAVITTGGNLSAKFVIHTVGPRWKGGTENEAELLKNCYLNSLRLAKENGIRSLAFPNISTGIYGYPKQKAAEITVKTIKSADTSKIDLLIFACFDSENFEIYKDLLK